MRIFNLHSLRKGIDVSRIKQHLTGQVKFSHYRDGLLFYQCESGLMFPVPIEDTGKGIFLASDKAMLFMRWIRKHLEPQEGLK